MLAPDVVERSRPQVMAATRRRGRDLGVLLRRHGVMPWIEPPSEVAQGSIVVGPSLAPDAPPMVRLTRLGLCAMTAACFGCGVVQAEQAGPPTPGGQTPYTVYNPSGRGYYESLPSGYGAGERFPLLVFLHGAGERGNGTLAELPRVLGQGPPKLIEEGKELPAIVISPQTATDWSPSITTPFVSYLLDHYDVDPDRVYVTGTGIGGEGAWLYGSNHADTVAAIVPIAGAAGGASLRNTPVWAFNNHADPALPADSSGSIEDVLERLTGVRPEPVPGHTGYFNGMIWRWRMGHAAPAAGENPAFTVHAHAGPDASTAVYENPALWSWLFAQSRAATVDGSIVFKQIFQCPILACDDSEDPDLSQFNEIGVQPNGGHFSIDQGRLQLVRTGSTATDKIAALTRWTDLAGPPGVLHAAFDLGVSGWTKTPYQEDAMVLTFASLADRIGLGDRDTESSTFQSIAVKGRGLGLLAFVAEGLSMDFESPPLAANGTPHHVEVFLNNSGAAASYRAPDGSLQRLQDNGVALWVNGVAVVASTAAANGSGSTLTDFRIRWTTEDNGTWLLDNLLFKRSFPR